MAAVRIAVSGCFYECCHIILSNYAPFCSFSLRSPEPAVNFQCLAGDIFSLWNNCAANVSALL